MQWGGAPLILLNRAGNDLAVNSHLFYNRQFQVSYHIQLRESWNHSFSRKQQKKNNNNQTKTKSQQLSIKKGGKYCEREQLLQFTLTSSNSLGVPYCLGAVDENKDRLG